MYVPGNDFWRRSGRTNVYKLVWVFYHLTVLVARLMLNAVSLSEPFMHQYMISETYQLFGVTQILSL